MCRRELDADFVGEAVVPLVVHSDLHRKGAVGDGGEVRGEFDELSSAWKRIQRVVATAELAG